MDESGEDMKVDWKIEYWRRRYDYCPHFHLPPGMGYQLPAVMTILGRKRNISPLLIIGLKPLIWNGTRKTFLVLEVSAKSIKVLTMIEASSKM